MNKKVLYGWKGYIYFVSEETNSWELTKEALEWLREEVNTNPEHYLPRRIIDEKDLFPEAETNNLNYGVYGADGTSIKKLLYGADIVEFNGKRYKLVPVEDINE